MINNPKDLIDLANEQGEVYMVQLFRNDWKMSVEKIDLKSAPMRLKRNGISYTVRKDHTLTMSTYVDSFSSYLSAVDAEYFFVWTMSRHLAERICRHAMAGEGALWRLNPETAVNF